MENDLGKEFKYSSTCENIRALSRQVCQGRHKGQSINVSSIKLKSMLMSYLEIQPIFESAMVSLRAAFKKAGRRFYDQI